MANSHIWTKTKLTNISPAWIRTSELASQSVPSKSIKYLCGIYTYINYCFNQEDFIKAYCDKVRPCNMANGKRSLLREEAPLERDQEQL